ncbi:thioredoxin domain-containing protein [Paractinoplanes ferrugineus]|uniref:Membrane protein n=1 Tax=Paractinoplanes ferrugineus TaxID=113564 RepID=A0A919MEK5_9ACTN|nr:thioredoxin domain-containing protein [Actinoplanes ferrugineus]GIE09630.1 membrane protein [Actinoplanes ferrugineus]
MSKGQRDRTAAKRIVEQQKAADRRRTVTIWTSVAVVAVLVVAGVIGWVAFSSQEKKNTSALTTPSVAVDEGTAFAFGTGKVTVDLYEDFMCPICNEFENASATVIDGLISQNKATVRYHPVAILDRFSNGTEYSTRAAGAAAAAAQGGKFREFHKILYANQPEENSSGLDNAKIIELGKSVGLGDDFATAVNNKTYDSWATKVTETFSSRNYNGTPTVVVNGKQVQSANGGVPGPDDLTKAVEAAAG